MTRDFIARWAIAVTIGLALAGLAPSAAAQDPAPAEAPMADAMDASIVDVLAADGRFTVLLSALSSAGLDSTLAAGGPFTVFAPTDEAFAALPEGTLEVLSPDELRDILLLHVAAGTVDGATAAAEGAAESAVGQTLAFTVDDSGALAVNDTPITEADLPASNGVIHVIAGVLLTFNEPEEGADD